MNWTDVTIGICSMPERSDLLGDLLRQLGACPGAEIVIRIHPPGGAAKDDFPALVADTLRAERRAWTLLLEDDVCLSPVFAATVPTALADAPGEAVTFFSRSVRDIECLQRGERWRRQSPSSFYMAQAIAVRSSVLDGFSAWAPSWYEAHPEHNRAADLLLGAWLSMAKARLVAHIPSLVQHRRVPSTLPHHHGARQSESYRVAFGPVPGEPR